MKFFVSIIVTAVLAFVAGLYASWWSIAVVSFVVSLLINQRPFISFICAFVGVFLVWFILASFINTANNSILANRIGGLLGIGQNAVLLIFITAFVGGLVAAFAALSASYLRK